MKSVISALKWYKALTKRLLKKPMFLITLLLIPLAALSVGIVSKEDSGIITVAIFSESENDDPIYNDIKEQILGEESAFRFVEYDDVESIKKDVKTGKLSCAWVFKSDLSRRISSFVRDRDYDAVVDVYVSEDSTLYQLSREKLYGYLYKSLSYDVFLDFMESKGIESTPENLEIYKQLFEETKNNLSDSIIEVEFINAPDKKIEDLSYVSSPLNGILAVVMIICCLAAMMYSLEDEEAGRYSMFPVGRRLLIHFASVLSAAVFVGAFVILSRLLLGDVSNILYEMLNMVLYIVSCVGFCTAVGVVCKKPSRMCFLFPITAVACLALCHVFVSVSNTVFVKFALPTLYYVKALYETSYLIYSLMYIVVIYTLCFGIYKLTNRE